MKISRLITALFAAASVAALGGCASAPAKLTGDEPLTVMDFTKADNKLKLTGVKRVAIPNFFVQFVRDQTVEVKARLGSASYTTQTRGADAASLQKIADGFYDDFVAELKPAGIDVIPLETLEANADFQEIRTSARKSPFIEESNVSAKSNDNEKLNGVSVLVSAKNLPINIMTVFDKRWLAPSVSDSFKGATLVAGRMKMAKAVKVPLLDVRLTVSMVTQKGTSQDHTGVTQDTSSFKFKSDVYPRFVEQGTRVSIVADGDAYSLTKPVVIKDLAYTGESSGDTSTRGSGLFGMLGRAVGGSEALAADAYIDVQPDDFTARVSGRGKEVVHLLVEAMTK